MLCSPPGTISATSEGEGKGTVVNIEIPVCSASDAKDYHEAVPKSAAPEAAQSRSTSCNIVGTVNSAPSNIMPGDLKPPTCENLNILIVDDSTPTRKMMARLLKTAAICQLPQHAEDGMEAVSHVKKSLGAGAPFDVILMDFMMPKMDGPTATKEIRDLGYNGFIIGVTGTLHEEDQSTFMLAGADIVLGKPVSVKDIEGALRQRCAREE